MKVTALADQVNSTRRHPISLVMIDGGEMHVTSYRELNDALAAHLYPWSRSNLIHRLDLEISSTQASDFTLQPMVN